MKIGGKEGKSSPGEIYGHAIGEKAEGAHAWACSKTGSRTGKGNNKKTRVAMEGHS